MSSTDLNDSASLTDVTYLSETRNKRKVFYPVDNQQKRTRDYDGLTSLRRRWLVVTRWRGVEMVLDEADKKPS